MAINNIYVSDSQTNGNFLNKLDTLTSCIKNTNAIFNNESSETQNHDSTKLFKDELNKRKLKFYQARRSQELSECRNSLISGDDKFIPDKFCPRINKNTLECEKQLKQDDAIDNVVLEIKLLQARWKDFHLKVKEIDESMLNKFENLDKDNKKKILIKEYYQRHYQNKEIKSRDIQKSDSKLDKLN